MHLVVLFTWNILWKCQSQTVTPDTVINENLMEIAINNRPLAYLSDDHLGTINAISFDSRTRICEREIPWKIVNVELGYDIKECEDRFLHLQNVSRDCWVRFSKECLNELRQMNLYREVRPLQKLIAFEIAESAPDWECSGELEVNKDNETVGRGDSIETEPDTCTTPRQKAAIDIGNTQRLRELYYS